MQHNQTHTFKDPLLHARGHGIIHFLVRGVAPPGQNVCPFQDFFGKPMLRLAERSSSDQEFTVTLQRFRERSVNPLRINAPDFRVVSFVNEFVPNRYADGVHRLIEWPEFDVLKPAV